MCMDLNGHPCLSLDAHWIQSNRMTNRSMNGLVFLLHMVPRYGIDDTIQRVTFVIF